MAKDAESLAASDARTVDCSGGAPISTVDDVEGHIRRWEALKSVLKSLPLISPVDHYHLASRFGKRRDPFTKRRSMHYGLDLAGWNRSPVFRRLRVSLYFLAEKAVLVGWWRLITATV